MSDDVSADVSPQDGAFGPDAQEWVALLADGSTFALEPPEEVPELPLDLEGFYIGHQEFFHAFAEIHLGSQQLAVELVHQVFLEITAGWDELLQEGDLEQQALAVLHRHVTRRLEHDGRRPAFVINAPIARALNQARESLEMVTSRSGLYEAITELPTRQFTVIVLRYLLGYETQRIARFMGLHERTVDYHGRKGTERLRVQLCLPATPRPKKGDEK
ncbi:sigma-70 family RNA polymerase sigma factor [Streptomyces goshikiensis]|uniref:sigma-70 family RNA polymerase sigma factor n=1 Tax=Streptomyces goshikiensis TaxID=1942 RepID=UPI00366548CC